MKRAELVGLLQDGIDAAGGEWVDLGAGEGAFTEALRDLVGPEARIVAVDRDARAVGGLRGRFEVIVADFTRPLDLHDLDGVLMANSLHFVRHQDQVLESVRGMLKPGGRLLIVEYGTDRGNAWVPHPFTYQQWETKAARAGFRNTRLLHTVPSRWLGSMYSALSLAPLGEGRERG